MSILDDKASPAVFHMPVFLFSKSDPSEPILVADGFFHEKEVII
ncbi:hypothetical protein HMPREF1992_00987 [Selenomonas sp. oral taxon 892 str. F0426]|nr:hypothetical protein HMPREF1992_00987 [Selenomonas sp. oral taxon 892 str. F0426]